MFTFSHTPLSLEFNSATVLAKDSSFVLSPLAVPADVNLDPTKPELEPLFMHNANFPIQIDFSGTYAANPASPWCNVGGYPDQKLNEAFLMSLKILIMGVCIPPGQSAVGAPLAYFAWTAGPGPFWIGLRPISEYIATVDGVRYPAAWLAITYGVNDSALADNVSNPADPARAHIYQV